MPLRNSDQTEALIAYIPALHAGYRELLRSYPAAAIFVLGQDYISAFPRLDRDLRALPPEDIATAIRALEPGRNVKVVNRENICDLEYFQCFILPDEDVSRDFAEKHLDGKSIELKNIFLRWDGVFSNLQNEVPSDRVVSTEGLEKELMKQAVEEGKKSADWWRQIGALLVKDAEVVALGHIRYFPSDLALDIFGTPRITVDFGERPDLYISMHAEADLIAQAAREGISLTGASIYTSTFPCINCAFLIARSGISKVYYKEGYSRLDAEGVLRSAGTEIVLVKDDV